MESGLGQVERCILMKMLPPALEGLRTMSINQRLTISQLPSLLFPTKSSWDL
jgi:hypothetical protein